MAGRSNSAIRVSCLRIRPSSTAFHFPAASKAVMEIIAIAYIDPKTIPMMRRVWSGLPLSAGGMEIITPHTASASAQHSSRMTGCRFQYCRARIRLSAPFRGASPRERRDSTYRARSFADNPLIASISNTGTPSAAIRNRYGQYHPCVRPWYLIHKTKATPAAEVTSTKTNKPAFRAFSISMLQLSFNSSPSAVV